MGERGRPQYIFACQGSPVEGWRKWASETGGGGYSLSAKQEVAQHLFLGIEKGSGRTAVCFLMQKDLHPDGKCDIPLCFSIP